MRKLRVRSALFLCGLLLSIQAIGQKKESAGEIHGNFGIDAQYYSVDTVIGAPIVPEEMLMNGFANLNFVKGKFSAGVRYEAYHNALQGFDRAYEGTGFPYRYARYNADGLDITVGSFYEQFGSGMLLRAYEARTLGIDNALDGIRVKYSPYKGINLIGLTGKQRLYFGHGEGIVRGFDGEISINDLIDTLSNAKTRVLIGGSFVSKYQEATDPVLIYPENVGCYGGRINVFRQKLSFSGEYVYKINDPSLDNAFIYKPGQGLLMTGAYSKKGLGISLEVKAIDNMSYRSDRQAQFNNLMINYLPASTKQHTYNLAATLYPYATQPNGEVATQGEIIYKLKKGTKLGGKYGTTLTANFATAYSLDSVKVKGTDPKRQGYKTNFLMPGEELYFQDFNFEIRKKLNKKWKGAISYYNLIYNMEVIQGLGGKGTINSHINVLDITYKIKPKHAIRLEAQHLLTVNNSIYYKDQGNWATGLVEYTISPHWFFAVLDQYNYGNSNKSKQIHYLYGSAGYIRSANRISLSYGRQRAGIFCVGGVCRNVPASNGVTLSITSSF